MREPRKVLKEFGTELPQEVQVGRACEPHYVVATRVRVSAKRDLLHFFEDILAKHTSQTIV